MALVEVTMKGVAAELVLGSYLPSDKTIFANWEDFYNYNNLLHETQLVSEYIEFLTVKVNGVQVYTGKVPANLLCVEKSFTPVLLPNTMYLRTECVERAEFVAKFDADDFNIQGLKFHVQEYDGLFKTASAFLSSISYESKQLELVWSKAQPIGNLCVLCGFSDGYLFPVYDAVNKKYAP